MRTEPHRCPRLGGPLEPAVLPPHSHLLPCSSCLSCLAPNWHCPGPWLCLESTCSSQDWDPGLPCAGARVPKCEPLRVPSCPGRVLDPGGHSTGLGQHVARCLLARRSSAPTKVPCPLENSASVHPLPDAAVDRAGDAHVRTALSTALSTLALSGPATLES